MTVANLTVKPEAVKVPKRREAEVVSREITALYGHIKDAFGKVQELGIQCLLNHEVAKNPALCNKMLLDMPRGIKKQSLADWFCEFGTLQVNPNAALRKGIPLIYDKKRKSNIEGAMQKAWFDVNPTPDVIADIDIGKRIQALLAACNGKHIKVNGKEVPSHEAKTMLRTVAALVGTTFDGVVAGEQEEAPTAEQIDAAAKALADTPTEPPAPAPVKVTALAHQQPLPAKAPAKRVKGPAKA